MRPLRRRGRPAEDLDWFVPHQANARIIDASAEKLQIAPQKVVKTVAFHGNTSAASVPLALAAAREDGRIKPGDLVMLEAMGAASPGARRSSAGRCGRARNIAPTLSPDGAVSLSIYCLDVCFAPKFEINNRA